MPRDGSGSINWIQRRDGSLIPDAEVSVAYTFRRHRRTLASVEVRANYSEPDGSGGTWTSPLLPGSVLSSWTAARCADSALTVRCPMVEVVAAGYPSQARPAGSVRVSCSVRRLSTSGATSDETKA